MNHAVCSCAYLKRKALTPRDRKNLSSVLSEHDFTVSEVGTEDLTVRFSQPGGDLRAPGLENWTYHAPRDTMNSEGKALVCAISSRKSLDQLFVFVVRVIKLCPPNFFYARRRSKTDVAQCPRRRNRASDFRFSVPPAAGNGDIHSGS